MTLLTRGTLEAYSGSSDLSLEGNNISVNVKRVL